MGLQSNRLHHGLPFPSIDQRLDYKVRQQSGLRRAAGRTLDRNSNLGIRLRVTRNSVSDQNTEFKVKPDPRNPPLESRFG